MLNVGMVVLMRCERETGPKNPRRGNDDETEQLVVG